MKGLRADPVSRNPEDPGAIFLAAQAGQQLRDHEPSLGFLPLVHDVVSLIHHGLLPRGGPLRVRPKSFSIVSTPAIRYCHQGRGMRS